MSAIFGIIDFEGRPLKEEWINSMKADLAHRGPDGQGLYREESVALGHMLLQVTPESVYDSSPYEEDGFVITANARLDEREAIMDRIGTPLSERDKITDPLLLLRSFKKFGKDFVKDIYGDFAFAIWDKSKKELFCARDQMGVKPFLYYFHDDRFIFSTELKAIIKLSFTNSFPDYIQIFERVLGIWEKPENTSRGNILRLRQANLFTLRKSNITIFEYWHPEYRKNKAFITEEDSAKALKIVLEKVISDHTRIIGNLGVPLSGGLDSGTLACLAARKFKTFEKTIFAVSSVYNSDQSAPPEEDEMDYINEIIQREPKLSTVLVYHSDLSFINSLESKFEKHFAPVNIFHYVDEAIFHQFNLNSVRRILSGFQGDMTVTNSLINPFVYLLYRFKWRSLLELVRKTRRQNDQGFIQILKSKILIEILPKIIIKTWFKLKGVNYQGLCDFEDLPIRLGRKEMKHLCKRIMKSSQSSGKPYRNLAGKIWPVDFNSFEEEWDCESSHHHIEITYPLADRRVVELLLQIPVEHFYAKGLKRGLIRLAMDGILPEKNRLRNNKGDYSPGHSEIIQRELGKIVSSLDMKKTSRLGEFIDIEKLKIMLEDISKLQNNDNFAFKPMQLVLFANRILFEKWNNSIN